MFLTNHLFYAIVVHIYMCVCAYISNFLKQSQDHTLFLLFVLHFSFNIISWAFLYILKKSIETFCNCSITFLCNIFNHCPIFGYLGYNKFLLLLMLKWVYKIFVHIVLFYLYLPKQWNCWHIHTVAKLSRNVLISTPANNAWKCLCYCAPNNNWLYLKKTLLLFWDLKRLVG